MANRLTKTPSTWFLQCKYCQITNMGHETELLDKARKLCKNHATNHFLAFVTAELDTLDHAILTPTSEIEILTQIHNKLQCDCLTTTTTQIEELTKSNENVTIPTAYRALPTNKPRPKNPPKTLLERLQNGSNTTHQPRKI